MSTGEGLKYDVTKSRMELLSPLAVVAMCNVLTKGAVKYDVHNWRKGLTQSRLAGAILRHLMAFLAGENDDPETGLPHMAHIMCEAMFSIELMESSKCIELDDRFLYTPHQMNLLRSLLANAVTEVSDKTK